MNQLVAPTSFITSISRRRANIAVRIVFQINRTAANSSTPDITYVRTPKNDLSLPSTVDLIRREVDSQHPRQLAERLANAEQLFDAVPCRRARRLKYDGMLFSRAGTSATRVAGEQLLRLGRASTSTSQYSTFSMISGRLSQRLLDRGRLVVGLAPFVDVDDHPTPPSTG